ncbi:hypothetical protein ABFS82_09G094800 [Erythranthe guttata]
MRSSSSSNAFSSKFSVLKFICSSIYLIISRIRYSNGFNFNPLIHLPTNVLYRNTSTQLLNINDFGAQGDGFTDDTKSFREVWKAACSSMSGAEIVIPEMKTYLVRPTDFVGPCRSKVTLRVYGFIVAPQDPEVWDGLDVNKWLYFRRVNRLNIEGAGGLINGMGHEWWARSCKKNESNPCTNAPTAVTFDKCKNLKVINITIFNSQQTHIAFTHCKGVEASGIILMSSDSPSTNGVHISASTNVELDTITVSTGNECISIGSNSSAIRMKNIFCRLGHGISIGSLGKYNSSGIVEDVVLNRAFFFHTETGLRIKTWQGGSGFVRKVVFENIWMINVSNPIVIDQYYCNSQLTCLNQTSSVRIENVSYIGIRGTSATDEAIKFACSDSCPCKRLLLENIELTTLNGNAAKSFCWEAYGRNSRLVYPPSCVSSGDIIIRHQIQFNSTSWRNDQFALF